MEQSTAEYAVSWKDSKPLRTMSLLTASMPWYTDSIVMQDSMASSFSPQGMEMAKVGMQ